MAYSHGRKFRRIAAAALTADPGEMRALIERILPPREEGAAPVLHIGTAADHRAAPAAIVAAFFADKLTGDEAAALLRQAEDPASLTEGRAWTVDPLADAIRAWREGAASAELEAQGDRHARVTAGAPARCGAAGAGGALVSIRQNTSAAENAVQQSEVRERPERL
jgi:hypothetical protein